MGDEGRGRADNGCMKSCLWIFNLISGFKKGQESHHWHGVVVELTVSW